MGKGFKFFLILILLKREKLLAQVIEFIKHIDYLLFHDINFMKDNNVF